MSGLFFPASPTVCLLDFDVCSLELLVVHSLNCWVKQKKTTYLPHLLLLSSDQGFQYRKQAAVDTCLSGSSTHAAHWMRLLTHSLLMVSRTGLFLRLLLGPVNVRAPRSDVRLQVKQEYNAFRVYNASSPSYFCTRFVPCSVI